MNDTQPTGLQLAVKLLAQIGDNDSDAAIAAVHAVMDPGQPGELPDGLQLAATLLDGDRDAFICGQAHPVHGLAPSDEEIAAGYLTAIAAIRAEHAQRLTLQHHACDQAQRIADLETRRDTLKRLHDAAADERDELRAKYDELLVALHGIGAALGIPEGDRSPYSVTCGVLERVNRLAEIEALYGVPAITLSTICALPLPTGPRQAVLLTDEQIERAVDGHGWTVSELQVEDIPGMARDIEAAVLAANNLGGAK